MDFELDTKQDPKIVISIEISFLSFCSASILVVMIFLGGFHVRRILTAPECQCKICKGDYTVLEHLNSGAFGEILKVECNEKLFILKKCRTDNITEADSIITEAKLHRDLNHRNIVQFIDDFIHIEFNTGLMENTYYAAIIMEYCELGDLRELIYELKSTNRRLEQKGLLDVIYQISDGLSYLHSRGLIHRDIKLENILLCKGNLVKIGDFGLARKVKKGKEIKSSVIAGTDSYMAPEILQGREYGKSADIWSLGCVIYELETLSSISEMNEPLWLRMKNLNREDLVVKVLGDIKNKFVKDLLRNIFTLEKDKRIKAENIMKKIRKERNTLKVNQINNVICT